MPRPRVIPEGGEQITIYVPRRVLKFVREKFGRRNFSAWIRPILEHIVEIEMKREEEHAKVVRESLLEIYSSLSIEKTKGKEGGETALSPCSSSRSEGSSQDQ